MNALVVEDQMQLEALVEVRPELQEVDEQAKRR